MPFQFIVEQELGNLRDKMARDSEGLLGTPTQTAIAAVVVSAVAKATGKWAEALGSAIEPVAAGVVTQARQLSRLSDAVQTITLRIVDELRTVGLNGLRVAGRVQRLEAAAAYAAPALHRRFLLTADADADD